MEPTYDDLADTVTANLRAMRGMGESLDRVVGLCMIALCVIVTVISAAIIARTVKEIRT